MSAAPATRRIGLLLFAEVELLDFAGPYEVFTTACRVAARQGAGAPPFELVTLAATAAPVAARAGLQLRPDTTLAEAPPLDWLLVPGGVVDAAQRDAALLQGLRAAARGTELCASVCTGVFLLAAAGLLPADAEVTTHWEDIAELRRAWPALTVRDDRRWIDRGAYATSAGISAGLDLSLHLVERAAGAALADATARQMDYRWDHR